MLTPQIYNVRIVDLLQRQNGVQSTLQSSFVLVYNLVFCLMYRMQWYSSKFRIAYLENAFFDFGYDVLQLQSSKSTTIVTQCSQQFRLGTSSKSIFPKTNSTVVLRSSPYIHHSEICQ